MNKSQLYDFLENGLLRNWRKEIEESDYCDFAKHEKKILAELILRLSDKDKKLLTSYALAIEDRMDYLYYNLTIKILNYGINFGINLQKSFIEFE